MKTLCTFAALTCVLALAAAPARASDRTIPFEVRLADRAETCDGTDFPLPFDMVSPGGRALGSGRSCIGPIVGCDPLVPFCRQTVDAVWTLRFQRGSVTARMTLHELLPSDSLTIQQGSGSITSGTGAFARARGRVDGGGLIKFTQAGPKTALFYVVRLKR